MGHLGRKVGIHGLPHVQFQEAQQRQQQNPEPKGTFKNDGTPDVQSSPTTQTIPAASRRNQSLQVEFYSAAVCRKSTHDVSNFSGYHQTLRATRRLSCFRGISWRSGLRLSLPEVSIFTIGWDEAQGLGMTLWKSTAEVRGLGFGLQDRDQ